MKTKSSLLFVAVLLLSTACSTGPLYDWGSYESSIYRMYGGDDSFSVDKEIQLLSAEVKDSISENRRIPPGKLAHVGYLLYINGRTAEAKKYFEAERKLYPESAVFMNRLLAGLH